MKSRNRLLRLDLQGAKRAESRNRFILLEPPVSGSAAAGCWRDRFAGAKADDGHD